MRAKAGGSWTSFLMAGPLAAIPLMAIFGVPELDGLSTSMELAAEDVPAEEIPAYVSGGDRCALSDAPSASHTPFDEGPSAPSGRRSFWSDPPSIPNNSRTSDDFAATPTPMDAADSTPQSSPSNFFFNTDTPTSQPAASRSPRPQPAALAVCELPAANQETSGTRTAAQRLAEMGISDYRLLPGSERDTVLFVCQFSPDGDPRILRRFEAEAPDPERAVQQVIAQIENWQQRR